MELVEALTFDDVLLMPAKSDVMPAEANLTTLFSRNIALNIPLASAAMDTVTESGLAIALARLGGIGIIHRNMTIEEQVHEVDKVKRSESGMIVDPIRVGPDTKIRDVLEVMSRYKISGVPVTNSRGKLLGILTNRDLRFATNLELKASELMTKDNLVTVHEGIAIEDAKQKLHENRIEKLLVVDERFHLRGLITVKDIMKMITYPDAAKDRLGRLRVGAAVGASGDFVERAKELEKAGADVIIIDTAHGYSTRVIKGVRLLKKKLKKADVVAGNIAAGDAAKALGDAGADAVKVGMGPGSICTTRVVTGSGVPQITAIVETVKAARKLNMPVIADGGIKYSGDIVKALAAGASSVMIGNLFAGTDEAPGELVFYQNRSYKSYRGMGSQGAMAKGHSSDRYGHSVESGLKKVAPEGIEGRVPYKGSLEAMVPVILGGLRAGMGYSGVRSILELQKKAKFIKISSHGLRESHVHDVLVTKEAPNYRVEE
ncbi:MAG: IMP dehydrogenase [Acidobacteriota bacterium]|nr:MAG: IMP dehydrogenase [Acidobacteriota bacterium]